MTPSNYIKIKNINKVDAGDFELNFTGVCGAPTLQPSPALEQDLHVRFRKATDTGLVVGPGIHLHVYYLPEFRQILALLEKILPRCDLLITTDSSAKVALIKEALSQHTEALGQGRLEIRVVKNQGRNLIPLLRDGLDFLDSCDVALHLHTKRSIHHGFGGDWFTSLLADLIGESCRIDAILRAFAIDPNLGLVMPQASEVIRPYINWGANFEIASILVNSLWPQRRLDIQAPLIFPAGMMFWFRPAALHPMAKALPLLEPYPIEPLLHDGTPLHALERLTVHSCEEAGLRWALTSGSSYYEEWLESEPHRLSVWKPQNEAYLAGVAALAKLQRETCLCIAQQDEVLASLADENEALKAEIQRLEEKHMTTQQSLIWFARKALSALLRLIR